MNKLKISAIAVAITLAFGAGALASDISKVKYTADKDIIAADFKSAKAGCDSFAANAKDVCLAEAKGKASVAKAELEAAYKPSAKTHYNAGLARAEADYAVGIEKCDDKAGNEKNVCVKEAKSARVAARADARTLLKTSDANAVANEKTAAARAQAQEKRAAARHDAATDKRDAQYAVAREKCEMFADEAKAVCVKEAKVRFGQS